MFIIKTFSTLFSLIALIGFVIAFIGIVIYAVKREKESIKYCSLGTIMATIGMVCNVISALATDDTNQLLVGNVEIFTILCLCSFISAVLTKEDTPNLQSADDDKITRSQITYELIRFANGDIPDWYKDKQNFADAKKHLIKMCNDHNLSESKIKEIDRFNARYLSYVNNISVSEFSKSNEEALDKFIEAVNSLYESAYDSTSDDIDSEILKKLIDRDGYAKSAMNL